METMDATVLSHALAFKDAYPSETVDRIKCILEVHGIKTSEVWGDSGIPCCYSLRVGVQGTAFGTNGKGVTKEFALASAYGELMERLQLGWIFKDDQQKENTMLLDSSKVEYLSVSDLLSRNQNWYSMYVDELFRYTGCKFSPEELLSQYVDDNGLVPVVPYYCANKNSVEYLPSEIKKSVYSTNGCAAGNTPEEALVQAISEIIERHYQLRILEYGIDLPDILEDILQSFSSTFKIISFLRNNGFKVSVKDCSLGDKFPVVCVCLVDINTGKYHTHFGAAPKLEIAVERTLTECFQGRNLERVCEFEEFCGQKEDALKREYLVRDLVKGTSERTPSFFLCKGNQSFNKNVGLNGTNNRELLKECFEFFVKKGYDILIYDGSSLGFPTYQVIIPGYSEVFSYRFSAKENEKRYINSVIKVLRNPTKASFMDIIGFMNHSAAYSKTGLVRGFCKDANLPAEVDWKLERYLRSCALAHVYYTLNKKEHILNVINSMIPVAPPTDIEYLICLKRYFSMSASGYDEETIRSVLQYFHKPDSVSEMYSNIEIGHNLFDRIVLKCDEKCDPKCKLYTMCRKKETDKLKQMIDNHIRQLDQTKIAKYLYGL